MSRLARIAAVSACLLVLFGCGSSGDDDSSSDASSSATTAASGGGEFASQLDSTCTDAKAAVDSATNDLSSALNELRAATSAEQYQAALSDLESSAQAVVTALGDFKSSVEALDIPDEASDAVDSFTQALSDQIDVAQQIADSDTSSVAAIDATLTDVQEADGSARQALNAAAEELGAGACAPSTPNTAGTGAGATTTTAAG